MTRRALLRLLAGFLPFTWLRRWLPEPQPEVPSKLLGTDTIQQCQKLTARSFGECRFIGTFEFVPDPSFFLSREEYLKIFGNIASAVKEEK